MAQNLVAQKEDSKTNVSAAESIHGGINYTPRVDIVETDNDLAIVADLPGCRPEDVDVRRENGQLEIRGKCRPRQQNVEYLLNEYGIGDYYRAFTLNDTFDPTQIDARMKQGVLTIRIPKSESAKPQKIAVKAD